MKRFTETAKWDDPWFRSLAGAHKLIFLFVIDRCNNAGFWEMDEESMAFHTKLEKRHFEGAWKALGMSLRFADGWVWVRNFLRHQKNEHLNPENTFHRQIIALLEEQIERFPEVISMLPKERRPEGDTKALARAFQGPSKALWIGTGTEKNGTKEGSAEGRKSRKRQAGLPEHPLELRIAAIYRRPPSTAWSAQERTAFAAGLASGTITAEALDILEPYYLCEIAKGGEGQHRRDILTFLNNFPGETDRAQAYATNPKAHERRDRSQPRTAAERDFDRTGMKSSAGANLRCL